MPSGRALRAGKAVIELSMPGSGVEKALRKLERQAMKIGAGLQSVGRLGIAAGAAIGGAFAFPIKAASDLQETMNKFDVVFGDNATAVKTWSDDFAKEVGRSERQIADFLAGAQDLFVPLGFEPGAALEMSKQITGLSLDLASFNNMADADTMRDLQAALTGSGEVMKKYGVIVSEAAVKQELLNRGIDPKIATDQQKVQARLNLIMLGTTAAQGDAIRSAGSFANQTKALKGRLEDLAATVGQAVLPSVTAFVAKAVKLSGQLINWAKLNGDLVRTVGKVGVALAAAGVAIYGIGSAFNVAAVAVRGFSVALAFATAHPIVAAIAVVTAGIAALSYHLYRSTQNAFKLGTALQKVEAASREEEAAAADKLARLRTLKQIGKLTADERKEVHELAHELRILYGISKPSEGGLGTAGGVVSGLDLAEAQIQAARSVSDKTRRQLDREVGLLELQIAGLRGRGAAEDEINKTLAQRQQTLDTIAKLDAAIGRARVVPADAAADPPPPIEPPPAAAVEDAVGSPIIEALERGAEAARDIMADGLGDVAEALAAGREAITDFLAGKFAGINKNAEERQARITAPQALLDARFAAQQFGGRNEDTKLLRDIKKNTDPKNQRADGLKAV